MYKHFNTQKIIKKLKKYVHVLFIYMLSLFNIEPFIKIVQKNIIKRPLVIKYYIQYLLSGKSNIYIYLFFVLYKLLIMYMNKNMLFYKLPSFYYLLYIIMYRFKQHLRYIAIIIMHIFFYILDCSYICKNYSFSMNKR